MIQYNSLLHTVQQLYRAELDTYHNRPHETSYALNHRCSSDNKQERNIYLYNYWKSITNVKYKSYSLVLTKFMKDYLAFSLMLQKSKRNTLYQFTIHSSIRHINGTRWWWICCGCLHRLLSIHNDVITWKRSFFLVRCEITNCLKCGTFMLFLYSFVLFLFFYVNINNLLNK